MAALIPSASATGSGTMTLAGPSTNSNQTITIPDATGTMMLNGPAFSAYTNSTIQSISVATFTKITFAVEEFDTNNNFASSRFTPTVAGYYQVSGMSAFGGYSSTGLSLPSIYKNGSRFKDGGACPFDASDGQYANVSCLIYLNGSTDYIELYVFQRSLSTRDLNVGDAARVYFTAAMIRSA